MPNLLTFDSKDGAADFDDIVHAVEQLETCRGINQADILELPAKLATFFNQILRAGEVSQQELAAMLQTTLPKTTTLVQQLTDKGYLSQFSASDSNKLTYKINLTRIHRRRVTTNVWDKLDF